MWSKEDIDEWIDVLAHVVEEAYTDPEIVRTAPHNQAVRRSSAPTSLDDPAHVGDDLARVPAQARQRARPSEPAGPRLTWRDPAAVCSPAASRSSRAAPAASAPRSPRTLRGARRRRRRASTSSRGAGARRLGLARRRRDRRGADGERAVAATVDAVRPARRRRRERRRRASVERDRRARPRGARPDARTSTSAASR